MTEWFENLFTFERVPPWLDALPWWAVVVWLAAFGGCVGSFLNVVALRAPKGKDVVFAPSHCPVCGHKIRPWHNLPIIGYMMLRGRCRDCRAPIPVRYWLWEVAFAALFVVAGLLTPWL
ncbi:Leader peptidase PppA [Pseudobythopirellula maris]|uniref:Leader peptidase PppA n=1 Tax=Pseudobythopirellula maris TaxID=2527991 RepID=A0A5C5ZPE0_9BACT|nr:prepilin peptidase [Pseudobythopirellula maris]TWT89008.1 Leader peptidase PppA [Pseudobythopirellula maris]